MAKLRFWSVLVGILGGIVGLALFLPQFRIVIWDTQRTGLLYIWGGHSQLGATVHWAIYLIAALWGLAGLAALGQSARLIAQKNLRSIALLNWSAFFIAMELVFLLVAAEEVLTDLRVQELHADSYASLGSWCSFIVLIGLLFLPSRLKKALATT
ncbi:MAG: hypothetical protein ABDH91_03510 [Bacteroidia bacterium]